jgi:hypothetical protein
MELSPNNPGTPVKTTEPVHHPINIGTGMHTWTHNHCYAYVFDEEGDMIFTINTTAPNDVLIIQCLEAYFDGHRHGRKAGEIKKLGEIQRALGITSENRLG